MAFHYRTASRRHWRRTRVGAKVWTCSAPCGHACGVRVSPAVPDGSRPAAWVSGAGSSPWWRDARRSGPGSTPTRISRWDGCGSHQDGGDRAPLLVAITVRNPNDYDLSSARLELALQLDDVAIGEFARDSTVSAAQERHGRHRPPARSRSRGDPRTAVGAGAWHAALFGDGTRPPQYSLRCPHHPLRGQRGHGLRQHLILTGAGFGAGRRAAARSSRSRWVTVTVTAPNSSSTLPRRMKGP